MKAITTRPDLHLAELTIRRQSVGELILVDADRSDVEFRSVALDFDVQRGATVAGEAQFLSREHRSNDGQRLWPAELRAETS